MRLWMGGRMRVGRWRPSRGIRFAWPGTWRRAPPPALVAPEVAFDADVSDDVAADRAREQEPAGGTPHSRAPGGQGMGSGGACAGSGPMAQRLRGRRRERIGDPSLDRTLG